MQSRDLTEQTATIYFGDSPLALAVEDQPLDLLPLKRALTGLSRPFSLIAVSTAEEAVTYLEGGDPYGDRSLHPLPNLVVLDMRLPGMSGLAFLRWLRAREPFARLPVFMSTGMLGRQVTEAYEAGADFFLQKPITTAKLVEAFALLYTVRSTPEGDTAQNAVDILGKLHVDRQIQADFPGIATTDITGLEVEQGPQIV